MRGSWLNRADAELFDRLGVRTDVYDAVSMMADVRHALWSELDGHNIRIDAFRRNLEREHLVALDSLLTAIRAAARPVLPRAADRLETASRQNDGRNQPESGRKP
jgi:hypothetical protein